MVNKDGQHFLRQRREELGLSQGDLALRLNIRGLKLSRKAISEWERGKRQVQLEGLTLVALADALRWSVHELLKAMAASRSVG
jgi:transcriptional regulator with XRE-family HTH domain